MRDLVEYVAKSLVENPDAVDVKCIENPDAVTIELRVAPEDMGKIIGRQGRIAKALRTVVRAATLKEERPCFLEII